MYWALLPLFSCLSCVGGFWLSNFQGLLTDLKNEVALSGKTASAAPFEIENKEELFQDLEARISRFVPVSLNPVKEAVLDSTQKQVLPLLVDAASLMDSIYERQVWRLLPTLKSSLTASSSSDSLANMQLDYLSIMRGPWDRLSNNTPVAVDVPRPQGGGFYPEENFSPEYFLTYLSEHQEEKEDLESPYTMVVNKKRTYPPSLQALPYSQVFSEWLSPAIDLLTSSSSILDSEVPDNSLSSHLSSVVEAFMTNNFGNISKQREEDRYRIQISIGPQNHDEDTFLGLKTAFESYVYILDQEFKSLSRAGSLVSLESFKRLLRPDISKISLPEGLGLGRELQTGRVEIGELVYCSGAARKPLQSAAVNLQQGNRRVVLSNVLEAQYDHLLVKVAEEIMKKKQVNADLLSPDAYLMLVTWQELAKTFRTVYEAEEGVKTQQSKVTDSMFDIIVEAKSELLGIHSLLKEIKSENYVEGFSNKVLFTYVTNLLRLCSSGGYTKVRAAAAIQVNKLMEQNGLTLVPDRRYQVNFRKVESALLPIITELVTLLDSENGQDALNMITEYGGVSASMTTVFKRLENVPLDIKPVFDMEFE